MSLEKRKIENIVSDLGDLYLEVDKLEKASKCLDRMVTISLGELPIPMAYKIRLEDATKDVQAKFAADIKDAFLRLCIEDARELCERKNKLFEELKTHEHRMA